MRVVIRDPQKRLTRALFISAWFAAVGLFPLFYGPHEQLPGWQHTLDMSAHWAGALTVITCVFGLTYLAGVKAGLGQHRIDEVEFNHWRES